jgi:hypothetical protein
MTFPKIKMPAADYRYAKANLRAFEYYVATKLFDDRSVIKIYY